MPIQNLQELKDRIQSLPEPKEGHLRFYRGQNQHFGKILASAHRGTEILDRYQFDTYCVILAQYLIQKHKAKGASSESIAYWIRALSQHYGPGTEFLDVTSSVEVAVWFALTQFHQKQGTALNGEGKEVLDSDVLALHEFIESAPFGEDAYFYVLDIPKELDVSFHEKVVSAISGDDSEAEIFQESPRIQAQHASLINCGMDSQKGDMSKYLVTDPLTISHQLYHEISPDYTVTRLFPGPAEDIWFSRFLTVPYKFSGFHEKRMVGMQSFPVQMYSDPNNEAYIIALLSCVTTRSVFLQYLNEKPVKEVDKALLDKAAVILIPNPVITMSPGWETGLWNEELLWKYLYLESSKDTVAFDETVPSANVYFELGLLDNPFWLEIDTKGGNQLSPRSVWVRFYDAKVVRIRIYYEGYGFPSFLAMEYELRFDQNTKSIVMNTDGKSPFSHQELRDVNIMCTFLTLLGDAMQGRRIKPVGVRANDAVYIAAVDQQVTIPPSVAIPGKETVLHNAFIITSGLAYQSADLTPNPVHCIRFEEGRNLNEVDLEEFIVRFSLEQRISFFRSHYTKDS